MSLNPVEIELRKPSSILRINEPLRRLIGDFRNSSTASVSLAYQIGTDGGPSDGGGFPLPDEDVPRFLNASENSNDITFSWTEPIITEGLTGYRITCEEVSYQQEFDTSTTQQVPIDISWNNQVLTFSIEAIYGDDYGPPVEFDPISLISPGYNPGNIQNGGLTYVADVPSPLSEYSSNSVLFDETAHIEVSIQNFNFEQDGSVSFWVKNPSFVSGEFPLGLFETSSDNSALGIKIAANGGFEYGLKTETYFTSPSGNPVYWNTWHHVVFSWSRIDNEGTIFTYFDFFVDNVKYTDENSYAISNNVNYSQMNIGICDLNLFAGGYMDDFRYYSGMNLTDFQVQSLYEGNDPFAEDQYTNGVFHRVHYKFDESAGAFTVIDSSPEVVSPS